MAKREDPSMEFTATCIGVMMKMLREYHSDADIKKMFTRKKVNGMLAILNETSE